MNELLNWINLRWMWKPSSKLMLKRKIRARDVWKSSYATVIITNIITKNSHINYRL